jgi:hypothetical protein
MIDEEERGYLQTLVGRDFQVGSIAGTHASCLQDRNVIVRYIDDFIGGVRA